MFFEFFTLNAAFTTFLNTPIVQIQDSKIIFYQNCVKALRGSHIFSYVWKKVGGFRPIEITWCFCPFNCAAINKSLKPLLISKFSKTSIACG